MTCRLELSSPMACHHGAVGHGNTCTQPSMYPAIHVTCCPHEGRAVRGAPKSPWTSPHPDAWGAQSRLLLWAPIPSEVWRSGERGPPPLHSRRAATGAGTRGLRGKHAWPGGRRDPAAAPLAAAPAPLDLSGGGLPGAPPRQGLGAQSSAPVPAACLRHGKPRSVREELRPGFAPRPCLAACPGTGLDTPGPAQTRVPAAAVQGARRRAVGRVPGRRAAGPRCGHRCATDPSWACSDDGTGSCCETATCE